MTTFKEHKFPTFDEAKRKQHEIKEHFGYAPEIFRIRKHGEQNWAFSVIEPKNMMRVR